MNNYTTIITFIVFTIIGIALLPRQSVQLNPSDDGFTISVVCGWSGASGRIIENSVTTPLESALGMLSGVEKISSTSYNGSADIRLSFNKNTNPDMMRFYVASAIRRIYPQLPEGVSYPALYLNKPDDSSNRPLLIWTVNASGAPPDIQHYAQENIAQKIAALNGIYRTDVTGANPYEWLIEYNYSQLTSYGLSATDIRQAVGNYFAEYDMGLVATHNSNNTTGTNNLRISGAGKTTPDWSAIPVGKSGNRIVYLTDIAGITRQESEIQSFYRINGLNSINIQIYAAEGENQIKLSEQAQQLLQTIIPNLPDGYTVEEVYNATTFISAELNKITTRTGLTIAILLFFVLVVSRQFRYLMVTAICLVVNVCISFCVYYLLGVEIHLYSLAGITVSLGLLIDNVIVMTDHLRYKGNRHVFLAILASTLTTMASLSVIYFLPDEQKHNLFDFARVIIINLGVSLLVALFFIPALLAFYPIKRPTRRARKLQSPSSRAKRRVVWFNRGYEKIVQTASVRKKTLIALIVLGFGLPVFMLPTKIEAETWYSAIYNNTLGTTVYNKTIRPWTDKILGGSLRLFVHYVWESSYYGKQQETVLYIQGRMPEGSTVAQTNDVFLRLENFLSHYDGIDKYISDVRSNSGAVEIYFKPEYQSSSLPYMLQADAIRYSLNFDGIDWDVYGVGKGFSNSKGINVPTSYQVKITGYNYDKLCHYAEIVKAKFLEHPRVHKSEVMGKDLYSSRQRFEYRLTFDKNKTTQNSVLLTENYAELQQLSGAESTIGMLFYNQQFEQIKLSTKHTSGFDKWQLYNAPTGNHKLRNMADIEKVKVYGNIDKENQQYIKTVSFEYMGADKYGSRYCNEIIDHMNRELPLGYTTAETRGGYYFFNEEGKISYWLILLILAIIYFICAVLFESLLQPLAVVALVPMSFIGVFLTFYWFDLNFDQGGYAAFVLLCGITVNSSLYIINELNNLRRDYGNRLSANRLYIKAYNAKITPILLTVLSTILGFTPFLVGGQTEIFWFALAAGTIGGLIFSIIVIVLYLPIFFVRSNAFKNKKRP